MGPGLETGVKFHLFLPLPLAALQLDPRTVHYSLGQSNLYSDLTSLRRSAAEISARDPNGVGPFHRYASNAKLHMFRYSANHSYRALMSILRYARK